MTTGRHFVQRAVLAILLAGLAGLRAFGQQPDQAVAAATGCDLDAYNAARAEFERLQAIKQFRPDQVSSEQLTSAANAYVALGEQCYQALYANATHKIDDGGVWLERPVVSSRFSTFPVTVDGKATKWGAGTGFTAGHDVPGPGIAGGTVSYSFIANGVSTDSDNNVAVTSLPNFQACFLTRIRSAFDAWTAVANIQFVEVADNGLAFNAPGATGDIRIGSHNFDGPSGALAHGYYPPPNGDSAAGDVHFDSAEPWACTPSNFQFDIGLVALHEIGHAIGLDHEPEISHAAVMNPIYNDQFTGLQPDDINGARSIYGPAPAPAPAAGDDLLVDFGPQFGLWQLLDGNTASGWSQIHNVSPKSVLTGDLDGNGIDEIIADFNQFGIWAKMNNGGWFQLHAFTSNRMVTGDLNGNGRDDVIIDFPGFGIWIWYDNGTWLNLHPMSSTNLVTGDLNGNGRKELIIDFAGFGVWEWRDNAVWVQLHPFNSSLMTVGDFDANGKADIILSFPGLGIWNFANDASWSQVHSFNPTRMTAGDLDGDGKSDFVADFGRGIGIWKILSSTGFAWSQISTQVATDLTTGDLNGNGKSEVIANFGASGLWIYADNTTWVQIHALGPEALAVGDINTP